MGTFNFKQFAIRQDHAAMKVGTDGTMLGCWANQQDAKHILDIGTGTGLIALISAQKSPSASIIALEINDHAIIDATFNIEQSPFKDRVELIHSSLQSYQTDQQFDYIISNPPFFENSMPSNNEDKHEARHTDGLSFEELLSFAENHITPKGKLGLVYPIELAEKHVELALSQGWQLSRKCIVRPTLQKEPHRLLFELSRSNSSTVIEELYIEKGRHDYSEPYVAMCKDFYTIM